MAIDAIYSSLHTEVKPEWFNQFLTLEVHKKKPEWGRYVFIDDYFHKNGQQETLTKVDIEGHLEVYRPRFGYIEPSRNSVGIEHLNHIEPALEYNSATTKKQLVSNALGIVRCYDFDTDTIKPRKYFFSNGEYVVRQRNIDETDKINALIEKAKKENPGTFRSLSGFSKAIEDGRVIVVVNKKCELVGIQAFQIKKNYIEAEPITYIAKEASGQGIFAIYHEMTLEVAESVGAEYIYSQCAITNDAMRGAYEAYGYVRQKETKIAAGREIYMFRYPLAIGQQAFF